MSPRPRTERRSNRPLREVLDDLLTHARDIVRRAKEMSPAELDYAQQRLEWLRARVRPGAAGGLDTHRSGGQLSTPSIRFRQSYPQTRDRVVHPAPLYHAALNAAFVPVSSRQSWTSSGSGGSYGSGLFHR